MNRFNLKLKRWYACQFLGDEFNATELCILAPSPIRIEQVQPLESGERTFKLAFFHANYPQGVQGKEYTLQTIHRGENCLLARSLEHRPPRFLYLTDLPLEWLKHHFRKGRFGDTLSQATLNQLYCLG